MLQKVINKSIDEIKDILQNYQNMINEHEYNANLLEELNVYNEIYMQPNRKNCALLPARALLNAIEKYQGV